MQLMADAISVLGSRHNLLIEPNKKRRCHINRSGFYPGVECELIAGVEIDGRRVCFPLSDCDRTFDFMDQDMTPCTFQLTGIDSGTTLKLELTITTPFRPRDGVFSTTPVLDIRLRLSRLDGNFRACQAREVAAPGKLFLGLRCPEFRNVDSSDKIIRWQWHTPRPVDRSDPGKTAPPVLQNDAWLAHRGRVADNALLVEQDYTPDDYVGKEIHVSWCIHSAPVMTVRGAAAPFKYQQSFSNLDDVVRWAGDNPHAIARNARLVDGIFQDNNFAASLNHLLAQTLHSWLVNTYWTVPEGKDLFNVWEGNCYYLSTLDVEFTETPFYLTVWPELLGLQLDMWPEFCLGGEEIVGAAGKDTLFFMHDIGWFNAVDKTRYRHHMPVEQNTNYLLMSFAYWRRTDDFSVIERNVDTIEKALDFLIVADTDGDGVPDVGTANTIDDANPSLQFGKKQTYLAVKTAAALKVGIKMLAFANRQCPDIYRANMKKIMRNLLDDGWNEDHFNVLLEPDAELQFDGWDAAHIYACHGLTLLDMVGESLDLDDDLVTQDIATAVGRCLSRYGCRHTDYVADQEQPLAGEFGTFKNPRVGWVSMNMFRDIAAFYRGLDLRWLTDRYWDYQALVNTQELCLFFETFNGNRLMTYPRGVAIFGFYDALGGIRIDLAAPKFTFSPLNDQVRTPVLLFADWNTGKSPVVNGAVLDDPECLAGIVRGETRVSELIFKKNSKTA